MDGPGATGDDESEEPVETDQLLVEPSAGDAATRTLRSPTHHPPFSKPATPVPLTKNILSNHHKSSDSSIVDGLPLEPNVVVKQNGTGSQVSSAENSRSMALTFPLLSSPDGLAGGAAAATAAGHRHVGSNGSVTNGHHPEKTPRTMY
ncbi:hypothetical protein BV898_01109 [Hypsibius exemplaris]|uniref:Uncharacterized protein n=1 Tax=Hypsibius exemplaris TaxID=2072580 RepID=A0A1W0XD80_HYPEX|nr:hypothetical protein BV898_01109 [Hypsibius exemplaris]